MAFLTQHDGIENFMEALLNEHSRYLPIVQFLDTIIQNSTELTWSDCESIGLALGEENKSSFCAGIRAGMLNALSETSHATDEAKLRPILVFARKLNESSNSISRTDIELVRNAGWSDRSIEEVVGLVASLNTYSILANGLGFVGLPDAAFQEMGKTTVSMGGYTPLFQSFVDHLPA